MKKMFKYLSVFLLPLLMASCGEELVTKGTNADSQTGSQIITMSSEGCGGFHYDKPPVDILYVVDNSGSTNNSDFNSIKSQIANTINTISNDFDYHIYIAPLFGSESLCSYPLVINNPDSIDPNVCYNIQSIDSVGVFNSAPMGNNDEPGFDRVKEIIDANKSTASTKKIFRKNSNLIVVMISTGDDNSSYTELTNGSPVYNENIFQQKKSNLLSYLNSSSLDSQVLRFISLVPFSNCSPFKAGNLYRKMSREIYEHQGLSDDNTYKDSRNLCTRNYASIFQSVNNSIQKVLVGHTYDHWSINPNDVAINESNIDLKKRLSNGSLVQLSQSGSNGFQLLSGSQGTNTGYRINFNILEYPSDKQELKTGLIVKLNGNAKVTYPECIIAKTKSPTEYYGFVALNRKPDLETVRVVIDGTEIPQSSTNGWTPFNIDNYIPNKNIKVKSPTNPAPATPALNQSGYFLQLHGTGVYSNSQTIQVFYKAADIE